MRTAVIILTVLSILFLITTFVLGMKVRGGEESVRQIHFHVAMTTFTISVASHIFALLFALKNKPQPAKA